MERSNGNDFTQHVTSNGIGHQNYYSGRGHQIITGNGTIHNYNAAYPDIENSRQKIMQALCTSPYLQRKNRNPDRVPGTCEWFMNHHDFHHWRDNTSSSMLWVSANPGCGKSVLAKYLVNELKTTEQRTTCYFFFKDDFEDQRSAKGALSCILHQLFTQRENLLSTKIMNRFKSYRTPLANSYYELWQLWDILIMTAREKSAGQIICILDAFDECVNQERQDLATILREFYGPNGDTKGSVNLKFLITGRPYDRIRQDLIRPFNIQDCPVIHLKGEGDAEVEKIAEEIGLYIKDKISRIRANLDLTQKEEDILLQGLEAIPHQTYLWVYLTLEWIETEINNKISEAEIRKAISTLPRTVDEAYDKILAMSTDVKETKKLLHIVVAAERPLTLEEMDLALEIEQHHKSYKDLALKPSDRVKKYIRDLCGLFINITDEKIYLLHQTAKEFLVPSNNLYGEEYNLAQREDVSQGNNGNGLSWKFSLIPSESHRILFNICVWHLLFKEFEFRPLEEAADASKYLRGHLFLGYSANNWATHFRASNITEEKVRSQLQRLCTVISDCYPSWFGIYWANIHNDLPSGFTTLMIASYFGIETVVRRQLETANVEIDSTDGIYRRTALSFASENGFDSIVRLLIKGPKFDAKKAVKNAIRLSFTRGADINQTDRDGRTALSYAVWNGHLAIVKRLLKARARADKKDTIGGTPISYALCYGQEDIANELMRGAQPTSIDDIRRGLFVSAVKKGHEPVVKRLLDSGADTTMLINASAAVLSDAVEGRYDNIVRMLLARGVDVNHGYINDRVPLSIAIQFDENEHMIEMLLKGGAKMDYTFRVNNDFTTPLIFAVRQSKDRLVDLLVKYGADTTFRGHSESTPRGIAERMKMELTERLRSDAVWRGFNENDIYGENDSRDGNVASNISDRVQLQRRYAIVRMLEDKR